MPSSDIYDNIIEKTIELMKERGYTSDEVEKEIKAKLLTNEFSSSDKILELIDSLYPEEVE